MTIHLTNHQPTNSMIMPEYQEASGFWSTLIVDSEAAFWRKTQ
jgi:hypothetical protein